MEENDRDLARYVDPFLGNGTIDLPEPEGIASTWFFLKAQTGNTHPGACLPFGMMSVCPYSGGVLSLRMGKAPSGWAAHNRPPSFA